MSYYLAKRSQIAKQYLEQRDADEVIAERKIATDRYIRSQAWIAKYQARGVKTAFNWSPTITVTAPEETTSVEKGYEEGVFTEIPQAAEVGVAEGVGDPPQEQSAPGVASGQDGGGDVRGQHEAGGARWSAIGELPF